MKVFGRVTNDLFIPYFTAYLIHYFHSSKTSDEREKWITDLNSTLQKTYKGT